MSIGAGFPEVLAAAQSGADWAWERLYASVAGPVRAYVSSQGAVDPDDLTSEVLLQLVRGIGDFRGDEAGFRSWVFVIAHHRVTDERRRRSSRSRMTDRLPRPWAPADPVADGVLDQHLSPEWTERLATLSADQRSVLLLRVVGGLSADEVAEVLGKKPGTVRVLQHRAVQRIRDFSDEV